MSREIRVSPDGAAAAIRTDFPADSNMAWGLMHVEHGGAWTAAGTVADWEVVS
jgi:hypothetical protein